MVVHKNTHFSTVGYRKMGRFLWATCMCVYIYANIYAV